MVIGENRPVAPPPKFATIAELQSTFGTATKLLTKKPWEILGISRASFYRLEDKPYPVRMNGLKTRIWRIKDLQHYVNSLTLNRKPGKRIGIAKATAEQASSTPEAN